MKHVDFAKPCTNTAKCTLQLTNAINIALLITKRWNWNQNGVQYLLRNKR